MVRGVGQIPPHPETTTHNHGGALSQAKHKHALKNINQILKICLNNCSWFGDLKNMRREWKNQTQRHGGDKMRIYVDFVQRFGCLCLHFLVFVWKNIGRFKIELKLKSNFK